VPFNPKSINWDFEKTDPSKNQASGDVGKLVKNWIQKAPGVFELDKPSNGAVLLAREALQNSWDSAAERQEEDPTAPKFSATFEFLELTGKEKKLFVEASGLQQIGDQASQLDSDDLTILQDPEVLRTLDDLKQPLRVMKLIETGTTGMNGPWDGAKSKMFLAMKSVSFSPKQSGLGGSYGHGKAGLIRASGIRAVFGYTAFKNQGGSDKATRRFLGQMYWNAYLIKATDYTGWATFADPAQEGTPLIDANADTLAEAFGIKTRDSKKSDEIGSTFLVVDPTVQPNDLAKAIERNWWPALIDSKKEFNISVRDYDGIEIPIRPKSNEHLAPFISAYEHLMSGGKTDQDFQVNHLQKQEVDPTNLSPGENIIKNPGAVCITWNNEPGSWTHPTPNDPAKEHRSMVALIRDPRMVVQYLEHGTKDAPFVRGIFFAHDANNLLSATEPQLHDDWEDTGDEDEVPAGARELAKIIKGRIRGLIGTARNPLKEKVPEVDRSALPELSRLMRNFLGGEGKGNPPPPPPPTPREVAITFPIKPGVAVAEGGHIKAQTTLKFAPTAESEEDAPFQVRLEVSYRLFEAGAPGSRWNLNLISKLPPEFTEVESEDRLILEGELFATGIEISLESDPYEADWTGEFLPLADRVTSESGDE